MFDSRGGVGVEQNLRRPFVTPRVYKPSDQRTGAEKIPIYTRQVDRDVDRVRVKLYSSLAIHTET